MQYYRTPETGELIRFDSRVILWAELRCDATTQYRPRWASIEAPDAQEVVRLQPVTAQEAEDYRAEVSRANSAARGELLLKKTNKGAAQ